MTRKKITMEMVGKSASHHKAGANAIHTAMSLEPSGFHASEVTV
jgi:hypothetical protein